MAKVFGPNLSIDAKGTIAKSFTFQKRPSGVSIIKRPVSSRDSLVNPSYDKTVVRALFKEAIKEWHFLTLADKEQYKQDAKPFAITGYNLFIKKFFMTLFDKIKIWDGENIARVTPDGYLDVKTHTPEKCFGHDYAGAQTDQVIITPPAGKRIEVVSVYVSSADDSTNITLKFQNSGSIFFKLYTKVKRAHTGNVICALGGVDESILLTCPSNTFISIGYDLK